MENQKLENLLNLALDATGDGTGAVTGTEYRI